MPKMELEDAPNVTCLAGKTIAQAAYESDGVLEIRFTDGSLLTVAGAWHNDSTAGTWAEFVSP